MPNDQLPKGDLMTLLALPLPASCLEMKEGRIQLGQCLYEVVLKTMYYTQCTYFILLDTLYFWDKNVSRQETKSNLTTFGEFYSFSCLDNTTSSLSFSIFFYFCLVREGHKNSDVCQKYHLVKGQVHFQSI